ncbi:MAG TPA: DUF2779 domain-containing protein [Gemmatimonadales bacterium]|nr:DUF2779 domain-containing protein [Gemmatimonadales bacterium]
MPDSRLSKSRFLAGLQCHKQLWWEVHESEAPELEPDPGLEVLFLQGRLVEAAAHERFPGGALVERRGGLEATAELVANGAPAIFEAAFEADGVYVQVDVLARMDGAYCPIEVKAATRLKDETIPDVAIQAHVLRRNGLPVPRTEVMYLNPRCRYPDLTDLFRRVDVTDRVEELLPRIPELLEAQRRALAGDLPTVPTGDHCTAPRACAFLARCWPVLPDHHVSTLYGIQRKRLRALLEGGFTTLAELPSDLELSAIHARQVRAVREDRLIVEPTLAGALDLLPPGEPVAFLDFETVGLAIPIWNGCRPWEHVPVQFSCETVDRRGHVAHHEFLPEAPPDPRTAVAAAVVAACRDARWVIAYNSSFERECLKHLARAAPTLADQLEGVADRLVDLLPLVRNHVYHPAFGGSFGLKSVVAALLPDHAYRSLEISDGEQATVALARMYLEKGGFTAERREALRAYCRHDTVALVRLVERLRGLAGGLPGGGDQIELF